MEAAGIQQSQENFFAVAVTSGRPVRLLVTSWAIASCTGSLAANAGSCGFCKNAARRVNRSPSEEELQCAQVALGGREGRGASGSAHSGSSRCTTIS